MSHISTRGAGDISVRLRRATKRAFRCLCSCDARPRSFAHTNSLTFSKGPHATNRIALLFAAEITPRPARTRTKGTAAHVQRILCQVQALTPLLLLVKRERFVIEDFKLS
jgi:hypothetical protein